MLTSNLLRSAAWLLLLGTASASPAPVDANAAKTATLSSTSTLPADATGALVTASTGAAKPAATKNADVAACDSANAEFKPFCLPKNNEVFYPDSTHSVIWDPAFFPGKNGTLIKIIGFYTNNETVIPTKGPPKGEEEAFASDHIAAGWGYYQWKLSKSLLQAQSADLVNITLRIVALEKDGLAEWYTGPTVTLRYKPKKEKPPKPQKATDEHALYIALPTVFGVCLLVVAAIFFSNRQTRTIEIGDLVNRARKSSSRRKGLGGLSKKDRARNKEQNIRLMERNADSDEEAGWDEGWGESASTTGGRRVDRKRV